MPELPEVQTVVITLAPRVVGARICAVAQHRSDIVAPAGTDLVKHLTEHVVSSIERRGKRIVLTLDNGERFFIHLGMTGRLTIESFDAPILKHTHLVLDLASRTREEIQLRFRDPRRFGGVFWLGFDDPGGEMGP